MRVGLLVTSAMVKVAPIQDSSIFHAFSLFAGLTDSSALNTDSCPFVSVCIKLPITL